MKRVALLGAVLLICMASQLRADTYVYVGSWEVDQGPSWVGSTAYTGQQAAALLFGNSASDYVISTVSNQVADINDSNWVSTWGGACDGNYPCGTIVAQNFVQTEDGLYDNPGDTSAYVSDWAVGSQYTNYAFLDESLVLAATPEPSSLLLLGSGILGLALIMRRKLMA
jgi:hypothetical protein